MPIAIGVGATAAALAASTAIVNAGVLPTEAVEGAWTPIAKHLHSTIIPPPYRFLGAAASAVPARLRFLS